MPMPRSAALVGGCWPTYTKGMFMASGTEIIVALPQDVQAELTGNTLKVRAGGKEVVRVFKGPGLSLEKRENSVMVKMDQDKKKKRAILRSVASHIENMVAGLKQGYEYRLEIVYSHFPISVKVTGNAVEIVNVGGAKHPVKSPIVGKDTRVEIKGKDILVRGVDREAVGQTAANMERATRIKGKDIRVFQDGIYIAYKGVKK